MFKVPNDGTNDVFSTQRGTQDRTDGQFTFLSGAGAVPSPPQTITLSAKVIRLGALGSSGTDFKNAVAKGLGFVLAEFAGEFGLGFLADDARKVGVAVVNTIGKSLGLE